MKLSKVTPCCFHTHHRTTLWANRQSQVICGASWQRQTEIKVDVNTIVSLLQAQSFSTGHSKTTTSSKGTTVKLCKLCKVTPLRRCIPKSRVFLFLFFHPRHFFKRFFGIHRVACSRKTLLASLTATELGGDGKKYGSDRMIRFLTTK